MPRSAKPNCKKKDRENDLMNILVLSCGTRVLLMQYFKKQLAGKGRLVGTDCNPLAPALFEADAHYVVPRITHPDYIKKITQICQKENISGVLTLIDPEISLLAKHKEHFAAMGVTVLTSSYEAVECSFNKMEMYRFCKENGIRAVASFASLQDAEEALREGSVSFPLFVKPVCGSCSKQVQRVDDLETLRFLCRQDSELMIQEFMEGTEIGADVYIDGISGRAVSIFTKKKLLMRAGETDKSVSFIDEKLFAFIKEFVERRGFRYQIDIDLFEKDGEYYISEVNPRFGGGYPHAYECGCDFTALIVNNLAGNANEEKLGGYPQGVYMMKYPAIQIIKGL